MFDWLFGHREKKVTAPEVVAAIAKRDELFEDADRATDAAKGAMREVDRVQQNLLQDYEDAERARLGDA